MALEDAQAASAPVQATERLAQDQPDAAQDSQPPQSPGSAGHLCECCHSAAVKYRCPGCGLKTCSLACSKGHKASTGCTGKRSRTELVKLDSFDERQLLSDIRLLEEIDREHNAAVRREPEQAPYKLPMHLQELVQEARKRRVNLEILTPGMHKRSLNDTYHERRTCRLLWHVEWHFVAAELRIHDSCVPEESVLAEVLHQHTKPQRRGFKDDEKLQAYVDLGAQGLTVVMRRPRCRINAVTYDKIDTSKSLGSQLERRTVIEYPTLLVLLPHEVLSFNVQQELKES